jgi:tetratricopeptide (TPR) repeat protein
MGHIPEGELALFAFDPTAQSDAEREAIERHTAVCGQCRTRLDFFAVTEADLTDADIWEESLGSATRDSLFAYASQIADEDNEADEMLQPLFAAPAKTAWTNLHRQRRFLTGGVARRLSAHAHDLCESEPLEALTFADAAISVAEALSEDEYPANTVYEMRGTAWRERASALMFLGDFPGALDSVAHAERAYKKLTSPSLGLASSALVRAGICYCQQRFREAATLATDAELAFAHLGEDERRVSALYLRATILFETRDLEGASVLFDRLAAYGEVMNNPRWIGRALNGLGNCAIERGDIGMASVHLHKVRALFSEVGSTGDQLSADWGIGRLLLHAGKSSDAVWRLRDVAAEFEKLGMVTDSALVGLDVAEGLLALGETRQIVDLAAHVFGVFKDAGMLTGALTAMAYIKEAAAAGTLTSNDVQVVREFLRRVERQPDLLFVPPPPNIS